MATDPQSLLEEARCYDCYGLPGQLQLMKVALLAQLLTASNPMADTTPQTLLSQANCYACYGNSTNLLLLMELALLKQIVDVLGGGGSTSIFYTNGGTTAQRDAITPTQTFGIWILTDSVPPYQLSVWNGSAWI